MTAALLSPIHLMNGRGSLLNCIGDHQCLKLSAEQTGGALTLVQNTNTPGFGIPTHYHTREDETFVIQQGQVRFTVAHEVIIANPGDTVFAPRMIQHSWYVIGDRPAVMLTFITPGGLEVMFSELASLGMPPDMKQVEQICNRYGVHFVPGA